METTDFVDKTTYVVWQCNLKKYPPIKRFHDAVVNFIDKTGVEPDVVLMNPHDFVALHDAMAARRHEPHSDAESTQATGSFVVETDDVSDPIVVRSRDFVSKDLLYVGRSGFDHHAGYDE